MSYDFLAQQMYNADIMANLNRLRHYIMGRTTWDKAKKEIDAFNDSFADMNVEKLSSIIVSQMLFASSDKENLAFEFSNVLNAYLAVTYPEESNRCSTYNEFRDIARELSASPSGIDGLSSQNKEEVLRFLQESIYSLAAKDVSDDFDSPLNAMGL